MPSTVVDESWRAELKAGELNSGVVLVKRWCLAPGHSKIGRRNNTPIHRFLPSESTCRIPLVAKEATAVDMAAYRQIKRIDIRPSAFQVA